MAKAKKTKEKSSADKSKAKELALEFHKKMQASARVHTKALKVSLTDFKPPEGTDGAVPTNVLCADLIMRGGFPRHRMTTVSGDMGAGKTSLIQSSMGPQLAKGIRINYNDLEGAADYSWMLKNGCDMNQYIENKTLDYIRDFHSGDDAMRYMSRMMQDQIKHGAADLPFLAGLFYYDSIPAAAPEALVKKDTRGDSPLLAIMLSKFIPMLRSQLHASNSVLVMINQLRENPRQLMGNPEYEPGGGAPEYYADIKLRMKCVGSPKNITLDDKHPIIPKDSKFFRADGVNLEQNPDGSIDQYRYTHIHTFKNRVMTPKRDTYMRIWIADSSGIGQGIDTVFDTIRFYEEIGWCRFVSKDEVWLKTKEDEPMKKYDYWDLKAEILTHTELREQGGQLIESGKAFAHYFERIKNMGVKWVAPPDSEEEDAPPPEADAEEEEARA